MLTEALDRAYSSVTDGLSSSAAVLDDATADGGCEVEVKRSTANFQKTSLDEAVLILKFFLASKVFKPHVNVASWRLLQNLLVFGFRKRKHIRNLWGIFQFCFLR